MKINRIALATDFSDNAMAAAKHAKILAEQTGAHLIVFHVFNPKGPKIPAHYYLKMDRFTSWMEYSIQKLEEKALHALRELENFCSENEITCEKKLLKGFAPEKIVSFVEMEEVDLLVMGKHGYTAWEKRALGTTADYVVRNACCSITLVVDKSESSCANSSDDIYAARN